MRKLLVIAEESAKTTGKGPFPIICNIEEKLLAVELAGCHNQGRYTTVPLLLLALE